MELRNQIWSSCKRRDRVVRNGNYMRRTSQCAGTKDGADVGTNAGTDVEDESPPSYNKEDNTIRLLKLQEDGTYRFEMVPCDFVVGPMESNWGPKSGPRKGPRRGRRRN